ncbi:sensor histidine kinase [Paenibacillus durus]|uniref:sensor histidine kinase n=1 Tax=Paenibacillus durus TaxID=44251 RepID=UPI000684C5D0|nr:ATP-binding protein [Paenibacillus durus]
MNATVFLLVFAVLGVLLYIHMQYRLLHETDESLLQAKSRIQSMNTTHDLLKPQKPDQEQDDRIAYLFWDANGQPAGQITLKAFPLDQAGKFHERENEERAKTVSVEGNRYRVLQIPVSVETNGTVITSVSLVKNIRDVERTLDSLLRDIGLGVLAGAIIFILAGIFLANRALIPIRSAWDKQQRFVADASHELRTPTAIIRAQSELILKSPTRTIEQESPKVAVILQEARRMGKLLDDLLTLARSDSNRLEIQPGLFALDAMLAELADHFRLLADIKKISIQTEMDTPLSLWGDEARIRQLLIILLDNALKYTSSGGVISLIARYQSHHVAISVSDSGRGIASEDLAHIFDRFYRGDKVRSRAEEGMGLGLSIAQWIVDVHGGTIHVFSKPGQGTRVALLFPRKKH